MTNDYLAKSVDSGRIGVAVEHLVAASCILASGGALNVSTSLVDDEGVDLVFHRRNLARTLAVQVKSRSSDTSVVRQKAQFTGSVRSQTFTPRPDLYMLFVVVDRPTATLLTVWFVPSEDFDRLALTTGKNMRRITASLKPASADQWRPYRMDFPQLPAAILTALDGLDSATP